MNAALAADRVVAVLSTAYFHSQYATDEWTAALVRQPDQADILLPVRVLDCVLPPLLANRIYIDLVGLSEPEATAQLIAGVKPGRAGRPRNRPFPEELLILEVPRRHDFREIRPPSSMHHRATPISPAATSS